jgi:hypothetical protein
LKSERYFEFASFTEINFERTFATIYLRLAVGYSNIKHWKHSNRTALAPFLRFEEILEQTES